MDNEKKQKTIQERQKSDKEKFLEELRKTPIITVAAKRAGIARATVYRWKEELPEFNEDLKKAMQDGEKFYCDISESNLLRGVQEGNVAASKYYLEHHHPLYKKNSVPSNAPDKKRFHPFRHEQDQPDTLAELVEELDREDQSDKEEGPLGPGLLGGSASSLGV